MDAAAMKFTHTDASSRKNPILISDCGDYTIWIQARPRDDAPWGGAQYRDEKPWLTDCAPRCEAVECCIEHRNGRRSSS